MSDWMDVPGYDGMYQVNRMGEVRSWRYRGAKKRRDPKRLTPYTLKKGLNGRARFVKLTDRNGKSRDVKVIRLMVDSWLGGCDGGNVPYHKNGDLGDNSLNNIGITSRKKLGQMCGAQAKRRPVAKVNRDGEVVSFYQSARAAARANFMSYQAVLDRCNGRVKKPFALDGHNYVFDR